MTTIHLLYVDDEENWLNAVGQILQTGEFVVDTATDGEMALQKMAEQRYDMILLDLMSDLKPVYDKGGDNKKKVGAKSAVKRSSSGVRFLTLAL